MKKYISLSIVAIMLALTANAFAWTTYGAPGYDTPLTDEQWAQQYAEGKSIAHNHGSDPVWGRSGEQMARDYQNGTPVRSIQTFQVGTPGFDTPLTDEEWARQYHGANPVGSAK